MAQRKNTAQAAPIYGEVASRGYDPDKHDLSPWTETPGSTRVSRHRYDHANNAIQVQWRNNKNHGYIYLDVPYEGYRSFVRLASKGKGVNSHLNNFDYRTMTDDELSAPSNTSRRGISSRARG